MNNIKQMIADGLNWATTKKYPTVHKGDLESYVESNDPDSATYPDLTQYMSLNVADFRTCFAQALVECNQSARFADQWCLPRRIFRIYFDEPKSQDAKLDCIGSENATDKYEGRVLHLAANKLSGWFDDHAEVLDRTILHALELLRARKAKDAELAEEPVHVANNAVAPSNFWPLFNKPAEKVELESHTIVAVRAFQRDLLILIPADFRNSFVQALAKLDLQVDVEPWMHPEVVYRFTAGYDTHSDVPSRPTFSSIESTTDDAQNAGHIIDPKYFGLREWFDSHPQALQLTYDIALEFVVERSRARAALDDEGVMIYRDEVPHIRT